MLAYFALAATTALNMPRVNGRTLDNDKSDSLRGKNLDRKVTAGMGPTKHGDISSASG